MKQELAVTVSFQIEVATTKIVKVKSHKRVVNGDSEGSITLQTHWGMLSNSVRILTAS